MGAELRSSLGHVPNDPCWTFDESVTTVFDDMLRRSIPQYSTMRDAVCRLAVELARPGTAVVDLGCAHGAALRALLAALPDRGCRFVGVDVSEPMLDAARRELEPDVASGRVEIRRCDLRHDYPRETASLTLAVLTLQFVPVARRQAVVDESYRHGADGGGLILVEKVRGASTQLDALMVEIYHELKRANGYTREEIERKRLALEGVLVPVTAERNEAMLRAAGYRHVECFWRWMNFAGWVAVK